MGIVGPMLAFLFGMTVVVVANHRVDDVTSAVNADCERAVPADWSMARIWNEALLEAVRLDVPSPTVHARNLYHSSAAMWDAWAAYDPVATGVFVDEDRSVDGEPVDGETARAVTAAREEAMSFAVFRILVQRYLLSPGAEESVTSFDQLMDDLCYDRSFTTTEGDCAGRVRQPHRRDDPGRDDRRRCQRGRRLRRRDLSARQPTAGGRRFPAPRWSTPTDGSRSSSR